MQVLILEYLPHGSAQRALAGCPCEKCQTARCYIADHGDDVVILCPWCGDWEDLDEIEEQLATGRFWCCVMCDKCPDRSWPRPEPGHPAMTTPEDTAGATDIELITQERLSIIEERLEQLDLDLRRIEGKIDRLLAITRLK